MGQKKWLETEQSVSDILKLKPGLDFDQEEKEMRIQRIMNLAAFNGKKERIGFGNFLVRQISYTGWKIWLAQGIFVAVFWILFFGSRASDMAEIARLIGRNLPFFFGMIAVAQVMILIPFLERSFRYQMYEMECATRFSCSGMLGVCLIYGTIGIVGIFGLCMAFSAGYKNVSAGEVALYFLVPLFVSCNGCMVVLRNMIKQCGVAEGRELFLGGESVCLICIGVLAVGARCVPGFGGHCIIWGVILTVAFLGMILQERELMKGVSYAA